MTNKLRLGPLPKTEVVRLAVALPAKVKADLDRYAEAYAAAYHEPVDAAALVPHMLAAFMERDRGFRKTRAGSQPGERASASTASTAEDVSSARETP